LAVPAEVDEWIRKRAQVLIDELRALEVEVTGDLADLLPGEPLVGRQPSEVTDSELLETCLHALVGLSMNQYHDMQELRAHNAELKRRLKRLRGNEQESP
jgi:hypothetical protein